MSDHDVRVEGRWRNDSTGGLRVVCYSCLEVLLEGAEGDSRGDDEFLMPEQIAAAVAAHSALPLPTVKRRAWR